MEWKEKQNVLEEAALYLHPCPRRGVNSLKRRFKTMLVDVHGPINYLQGRGQPIIGSTACFRILVDRGLTCQSYEVVFV
jgi:hypothetical protein